MCFVTLSFFFRLRGLETSIISLLIAFWIRLDGWDWDSTCMMTSLSLMYWIIFCSSFICAFNFRLIIVFCSIILRDIESFACLGGEATFNGILASFRSDWPRSSICLYSFSKRAIHLFVMFRRDVLEESIIFYSSNCAVYVIRDGFLFVKPTSARRSLL